LGCIFVVQLNAQTDFQKTLRGVENRYNRARTMQMSFQQSFSGHGRMARTESGELFLQKPGRMRWEYSSPAGKIFLTDGSFAWFYSPSAARVEKSKMKESDDLRAPLAFLMGRLDFQRDFREFRYRREGEDLLVTAMPKSQKAPYTEVEFRVAPGDVISELRVTGQDRSVMTFHLSNLRMNPALAPALFRFRAPEGVPVVEAEAASQ
jgi:outer membrane lipoprotein carrier protein